MCCDNEGYYCYMFSPKITFVERKKMDQISFFHVNVLRSEVYFPSLMFSLHYQKRCLLLLYIPPRSYHNRKQTITVFMNMVQIFGVVTEYFTSNDIHRSKYVSPILHFGGMISFVTVCFFLKLTIFFNTFPDKHLCLI